MKNKLFVILSIALLCSVSCVSEKNTKGEYPTIDIKGREFPNEIYSDPPRLYLFDNMLLTIASKAIPMINLYNIGDELELVTSYGTKGKGPGEFIYIEVCSINGDTIIVSDPAKRKVTTLLYERDHKRLVELEHHDYKRIYLSGTEMGITDQNMQKLDNQNYVARSLNGAENIFSIYDTDLNFVKHFGHFEFIDGATPIDVVNYMQGAMKNRKNNIIFATNRLPYVVMYTIDGDEVYKKWDDEILPVEVSVVNKGIRFSEEKSIGTCRYVDISDKYIYVLFSDAPLAEDERGGDIVYVYDYSGNKVARFNLEHLMYFMCVNEDDSKLYFTKAEDSKICEYDISKLLK
ncbi:MAG: BF3164 family lipoprotein [Rikenellaceae bacterium]